MRLFPTLSFLSAGNRNANGNSISIRSPREIASPFVACVVSILALAFSTGPLHAALIANWKADTYVAGANWTDSAASTPIVATPQGAPAVIANAFGRYKGVDLTGGKYFTVLAARNPLAGKKTFTLAAVFRPTAGGNTGSSWYQASGLIGMEQGGIVNDFGFGWSGDGGGQVKAGLGIPGTGDPVVTSPSVALNTTHAAVFTYNGTTGVLTLFVDGQQVATNTSTPGAGRNSSDFALGAMTSGGGNRFPGMIGELRIYDTIEDGVALSSSLLATYTAPPLITSFSADKVDVYEGDSLQLSWEVNTASTTGNISVSITRGAASVFNGTAATGNVTTKIPSLTGNSQPVTYTLNVTEIGGSGYSESKEITVNANPGMPTAAPQNGLTAVAAAPKVITLAGNDPNGGTLTYAIVTQPLNGALSGTPPNLTYTANAGYSGPDSFTFKVNDGVYDSGPATVALEVSLPPTAPTAITLSNSQISTTVNPGAFVANISSSDSNPGEAHTYSLVGGAGSTDNARFSIVGNQLRASQSFAGLTGSTFQIRIRSTDGTGLFAEQSFTLAVVEAPVNGIVINEILFNGVDNTIRTDFIELYNSGAASISLAGWRLSGGIDYQFPAGTTIAPGGYLLIAEDPPTIQSRWSKSALGPWTGALSSDGETVRLRDGSNAIVSEIDYKPGFPWPIAADGKGTSMELINPSLDAGLGSSWRSAIIPSATATIDTASPGAQNLQFATNAPPAIRQVNADPPQPMANVPVVITAKVTDPDGVSSVTLQYQIVTPGNFIPATLPNTISGGNIATTPLRANPAFENSSNWTIIPMNDDGVGADPQDGDGLYSATIPGQLNRTLVRYRIVVTDNIGNTIRVPYADDESRNFAYFVYNGVPAYQGTSAATLQTLPVYHFLTRKSDYDDCVAYDSSKQLTAQSGRSWENWEAALVYDGVVYDHIKYRLHGGNGRYSFSGKRAFRFFFNTGYDFQGKDNDGNPYPTKWNSLVTENCWENRGTYTYSLNEVINFYLWNQIGVPAPQGNWAHFRTITTVSEQPDPWRGDFWGLIYIHEDYDARFIDAHDLEKGNLYKLTRDPTDGNTQKRYQAPFAVKNGTDHSNIYNSLKGTSSPSFIDAHVNLDRWSYYHALAEAVRHYDYWPSGDNNAAYYFEPTYTAANGNRGKLWILPNDVDATWGPTWNNGHDIVHNSLFNDSASTGGDTATNPTHWPRYFNAVREVRDLLWQPDQINPLIDQFAAVIAPFEAADSARWKGAPADAGNFNGLSGPGITSLASLVLDMKRFAFTGGKQWPGDNSAISARSAHLDNLQRGVGGGEAAQIPVKPTITFSGASTYPVNDLRFTTSAFSDPQGSGTFGAIQWRMAEITDPSAPGYVQGEKLKLEWNASYDSGELTAFNTQFQFPAAACRPGRTYRARVRHKDSSGRWSNWSAPVQFTANAADVSVLKSSLVISEFMYHPVNATAQELALGYAEEDFEYVEVRNVSNANVDLSNVRFTKGIDFDFPEGVTLAPGASTVVVRNPAAFAHRYGAGKPIAGAWEGGDSLSNAGEEIKLSFGAGEEIISFIYDDASPWPIEADTLGYSVVLISPELRPNPNLGQNWRASRVVGGIPGGDDRITFASWSAAYPGVTDPEGDNDSDGIKNIVEYAMGGNPNANERSILPVVAAQSLSAGDLAKYLTVSFRRQLGAEDITYRVEFSDDFTTWNAVGVFVSSAFNGDGTQTETWRAPSPMSGDSKLFVRVRVTR